ncbi:phosphate-starvation-inducible PsiE family protein [candidate division KSB1 bacterium]|nr:phosphate-starvation-inducible PsiE family protein [candidate division KSB1 bacterium]
MHKSLKVFERIIVVGLLIMMMVTILFSAIELAVILVKQLIQSPFLLLEINKLLEIFGFFLMVLIGMELLYIIKAYLEEDKFHVEVVILVAMIAIARKVVILDLKEVTPEILYGIAAIITALSLAFYLINRTVFHYKDKSEM